jgi:hypothetical protein
LYEARASKIPSHNASEGIEPRNDRILEAETVHRVAGSRFMTVKRGHKHPTGSETVARYYKDRLGTRESHDVSSVGGYGLHKPKQGEVIQMTLWQSDKPIVVRNFRNRNGAKGLTRMRRKDRDTTSTLRGGYRLSTKLSSLTSRALLSKGCILEEPYAGDLHVRFCEGHQ